LKPAPTRRCDTAEINRSDLYQDFGHGHWHNSFIWGERLDHVAIVGGERSAGGGKTIALKLSRNVALRDFRTGHAARERLRGVSHPPAFQL
jgi:hypothetical protein